MRYVVLLLLSMWLLPADAQTKPILQQQLLNMAQQSQQIQLALKSDATEALKSMAADISQLHTQTLNQIVQLQGWPTKAQVTEEGVRTAFSLASHSNNLSFQQNMLLFIIQSYMDNKRP
jgi:antitoxin component of RelBE/YafQ-DinJ toxin-antitoxin module